MASSRRQLHLPEVTFTLLLPRDAMHSSDYAVARCPSVRPSVCLSVTRRYCVKTAKHILNFFTVAATVPQEVNKFLPVIV